MKSPNRSGSRSAIRVKSKVAGRARRGRMGGPMNLAPSNRTEWLAAACAAASGLLLYAAMPPLEWTGAVWFALVPLLVMARQVPARMALKMGGFSALLFWLLSIRFLTHVSVAGWLFLSAYCALYFLPAVWLANRWRGGAAGFAASAAVVWCGSEFLRGWLFGGFPGNTLGVGLAPWRAEHLPVPSRSLRVALVQTSIPQDEKWVTSKIQMIYERLTELTGQAQSDPKVELIIWPETALPDDVRNSEHSYALVWSLCTNGMPILAGSLDTALLDSGETQYFNSAFLFDAEGRIAGEYDKRHLVIFGEFIPFARWIPARWQAALGLPESISAGEEGSIFLAGKGNVPLAPLICFEDMLAELARADVRAGARMLVNITNDAWFDERVAPRQHMLNAVFRAVENRVPMVRAANTGVTCAIDSSGRVTAFLSDGAGRTDGPGVLWVDVPVPDDAAPLTFYARFGDMYGIACAVATALWLATAAWKRRKRPQEI